MLRGFKFCSSHGFKVKQVTRVDDFKVDLIELTHSNSGARMIQIKSDDPNNVFAASFRSRVSNSRGTPHILEHLVCCGSEMYPIRDPFMAMSKRSLNTFMNAWTGPDFIGFPFSSTNEKDFLNLVDVYLDLIYKPLLRKVDFLQEGWRLDLSSQPQIKGVVFNEMKGYYQSGESVFHQYVLQRVLYQSEYEHMYGGDPRVIPTLKHQELLEFYQNTINPSSSIIYFYGNKLSEQVMQKLDKYFSISNAVLQFPKIGGGLLHDEMGILPLPPNVDETSDKNAQISLTYVLPTCLMNDAILSLAIGVIQSVLFQNNSGLLFKRIISEGLAEGFGSMAGQETYGEFSLFNFAFQGVQRERNTADVIIKVITQTLEELSTNGFPQDMVDGALHQTEINSKMPSSRQGMQILEYTLGHIIHGKDVNSALSFTKNIQDLKQKLQNGYLEEIVRTHFLQNDQNTIIFAQPDEHFLDNLQNAEDQMVDAMVEGLTEEEVKEINSENAALAENQNQTQDLSGLPSLGLTDIVVEVKAILSDTVTYESIPIHFVHEQTNGLTFIKMKLDVGSVTEGLRQYLDMFCNTITNIGTEQFKSDTVQKLLNLSSTGFSAKLDSICDVNDTNKTLTFITISIACLDSKLNQMMDIFTEVLTEPYFKDRDNIQSLLRNLSSQYQGDLIDNSVNYAKYLANRTISESQFISDINFSTKFLLNLSSKFSASEAEAQHFYVDDLNYQMTTLMNHLFKAHRIEFLVHTNEVEQTGQSIKTLIDQLKKKYEAFNYKYTESEGNFKPQFSKLITTLPSQVNFAVTALQVPHYRHTHTAPLMILSQVLSNGYLHSKIREQGGAYGAGCTVSPMQGILNFWSYRDPQIKATLGAFEGAADLKSVSAEELRDAKFSVFQRLDRPLDPQDRGIKELFYGLTSETQNELRTRVLSTTKEDVMAVAQDCQQQMMQGKYSVGIFGSQIHSDIALLRDEGYTIRDFLHQQ